MKHIERLLVSAIVIATPVAAFADSANLLPNGDFSDASQITGWQNIGSATISWTTDDADDAPDSGSIEVTADDSGMLGTAFPNCFDVTGGAGYKVGLQSKVVTSNIPLNFMACSSYPAASCGGTPTALANNPPARFNPFWTPSTASGVLPADAQSVFCGVSLSGSAADGAVTVRYDNIFFKMTAADTVFEDGFDGQ